MAHPPVEMSEASPSVFGMQNYFGGPLEAASNAASQLFAKPAVLKNFNQVNIKFNSVLKYKSHLIYSNDTKLILQLDKMYNCLLICSQSLS